MQIGDLTLIDPYHGQTLFVACSGGLDSMVLAYWLLENGFNIELMHVNYHKRGEQSNLDQFLVEKFAQTFHIPCHVKHFKHEESTGNFQQIARLFRYNFFDKIAGKGKILTAHHQDDFIETFFLQLDRGAGMKGLRSILPENNNRLRPFLNTSKEAIKRYALEKGIPWRDDLSNFENDYSRHRWRNVSIPNILEQNPDLRTHVHVLTKAFQESYQIEMNRLSAFKESITKNQFLSHNEALALSNNDWYLLLGDLKQPSWVVDEFLKLEKTRFGAQLPMEKYFDYAHWNQQGLHFKFLFDEQLDFEIEIEEVTELPTNFHKDAIYLDPDKIIGPLVLTKWQEADVISPIGMKGSQKISKILKDISYPLFKREDVLVVRDDSQIHWLVGHKVGRNAIATKDSKKIWKVQVRRENKKS